MPMKKCKICFIGGDLRMIYAADEFAKDGHECAIYGFDRQELDPRSPLTRAADLASAIDGAKVVVAPIPITRDGATINAPLSAEKISLQSVLELLRDDQDFFGGCISGTLANEIRARASSCTDYNEFEDFALLNARPSAEAAVAIAIYSHKKSLLDCRCAIFGYGRIGRIIASILMGMGVTPTVFARSRESRTSAISLGCAAASFDESAVGFDIVFNTVPSKLYDDLCGILAADGILIDLASAYDRDDTRVVSASGLPGRFSPISAGRIIHECIIHADKKDNKKKER